MLPATGTGFAACTSASIACEVAFEHTRASITRPAAAAMYFKRSRIAGRAEASSATTAALSSSDIVIVARFEQGAAKYACSSQGSTQRVQHIEIRDPSWQPTAAHLALAAVDEGAEEPHSLEATVCGGSCHLPDGRNNPLSSRSDRVNVGCGWHKVFASRVVHDRPVKVVIPHVRRGERFRPNGAASYDHRVPKRTHSSLNSRIARSGGSGGGSSAAADPEIRGLAASTTSGRPRATGKLPRREGFQRGAIRQGYRQSPLFGEAGVQGRREGARTTPVHKKLISPSQKCRLGGCLHWKGPAGSVDRSI